MYDEMKPREGIDFCPNCSETIAKIRMKNSELFDMKRIVVLMRKKERYVEPDCCDPREVDLPYWSETDEGKELYRLLSHHFPE